MLADLLPWNITGKTPDFGLALPTWVIPYLEQNPESPISLGAGAASPPAARAGGEFCSQTQTPAQPHLMVLPHQPCEHCCGLLPLLPNVRIASKNSSHQKWHSHVKVSKKLLLFELTHLFSAQPSPLCSLVGFRMPHSPACAGSCV